MEIEKFRVGSLDSIFYVPSFLSPAEQDFFWQQVNCAPAPKWKCLKNRRLQNWVPQWLTSLTQRISAVTGFFPSPINHVLVNEYTPGQGIMPHQDGPLYFPVVAIVSLGSPTLMQFTPHQRISEIKKDTLVLSTGHEMLIGNHSTEDLDRVQQQDGQLRLVQQQTEVQEGEEKYDNRSSHDLQKHSVAKDVSVILMPGSLLIFKDSAYEEYLHGIDDCIEHEVDDTVVNADVVNVRVSGGEDSIQKMHEVSQGLGSQNLIRIQRTGVRISLTCRLIRRVQGKFLRL